MKKPIPVVLTYYDNQIVLVKAKNRKDNIKSSKHIKRRLKLVRHARETGVIYVKYIQSERNLADPFTKGLAWKAILAASKGMGLIPV